MSAELSNPEMAVVTHDETGPVARLRSRVAGFAVLGAVAAVLVFATRALYFIVTDSWVAPVHLSPQSDVVLQLQSKLLREQAEMSRVVVELERIDGDLAAIDAGLERLSALRAGAGAPLTWQADAGAAEQKTLGRVIVSLRGEIEVLERAHGRQAELTAAARRDLDGGLIVRKELQQQEQALDALAVGLAEKKRMLEQARHEEREVRARTGAYRAGAGVGAAGRHPAGGAGPDSVMPEVAASQERDARAELELLRLEAEKRNLIGLRRVAEQGLARQQELLRELESRPLYRAVHGAIDVAFVPYDQLDDVRPGARVMACTWGLVNCRDVGRVSEILDGEVATLDPWGDTARGQYAILELSEPAAIRQKVLRIRS
jgi:hypothetical protein